MEKQVIRHLIEGYQKDELNPVDRDKLLRMIQENESRVIEVFNEMQLEGIVVSSAIDRGQMMDSLNKVLSTDKAELAPVFQMHSTHHRRWWMAAASVVILVGIGTGIYRMKKTTPKSEVATIKQNIDIPAPVNNRATITLANGNKVFLDSLKNGEVAAQGNIKVVKLASGQIAYQAGNGQITKEIQYNTLSNPRGSKVIDITLADGSQVWLNAESSITYPVAFAGNERKVKLSGEGYFEVAHDATKPFHVEVGKMDVQVLGTHFNINAYQDEGKIKTTLLQGSVEVSEGNSDVVLKPGEQAQLQTSNDELRTKDNVDVDEVVAWKNGYFFFTNANIQTVMNQLERWYDIDVVYNGIMPGRKFEGEMQRSLTLKQVLNLLSQNNIDFKIEGKKLIVKP